MASRRCRGFFFFFFFTVCNITFIRLLVIIRGTQQDSVKHVPYGPMSEHKQKLELCALELEVRLVTSMMLKLVKLKESYAGVGHVHKAIFPLQWLCDFV